MEDWGTLISKPFKTRATRPVIGLIPGPDVPLAFGTVAYDGADIATNQVWAPMLNAAEPQNTNVDVGNGNLLSIPNPALNDDMRDW
jgi:hypothetical protein